MPPSAADFAIDLYKPHFWLTCLAAFVILAPLLLPVALRHQHVDFLNARRVQTLIHIHGSEKSNSEPRPDDPLLVDLDALAAGERVSIAADVA